MPSWLSITITIMTAITSTDLLSLLRGNAPLKLSRNAGNRNEVQNTRTYSVRFKSTMKFVMPWKMFVNHLYLHIIVWKAYRTIFIMHLMDIDEDRKFGTRWTHETVTGLCNFWIIYSLMELLTTVVYSQLPHSVVNAVKWERWSSVGL